MWELLKAGGWLMLPIVICSVIAIAIMMERALKLKSSKILPKALRQQLIATLAERGGISRPQLERIRGQSALGDVLATGVIYRRFGLDSMTMHMENRASVQIHALEKNINVLGTVAAISPLLGLLGTVLGIIVSFMAISDGGMRDPAMLAAGVSQALFTTAAGMFVAIPALISYRYFQRRVVDINATFEQEAGLLIQELYDRNLIAQNTPNDDQISSTRVATPTQVGSASPQVPSVELEP